MRITHDVSTCMQNLNYCDSPLVLVRRRCVGNVHPFGRLFVPEMCTQNAIFSITKQFRAMLSIDDLEVLHGLFKEPIIDIKFKMADGRRLIIVFLAIT